MFGAFLATRSGAVTWWCLQKLSHHRVIPLQNRNNHAAVTSSIPIVLLPVPKTKYPKAATKNSSRTDHAPSPFNRHNQKTTEPTPPRSRVNSSNLQSLSTEQLHRHGLRARTIHRMRFLKKGRTLIPGDMNSARHNSSSLSSQENRQRQSIERGVESITAGIKEGCVWGLRNHVKQWVFCRRRTTQPTLKLMSG